MLFVVFVRGAAVRCRPSMCLLRELVRTWPDMRREDRVGVCRCLTKDGTHVRPGRLGLVDVRADVRVEVLPSCGGHLGHGRCNVFLSTGQLTADQQLVVRIVLKRERLRGAAPESGHKHVDEAEASQ